MLKIVLTLEQTEHLSICRLRSGGTGTGFILTLEKTVLLCFLQVGTGGVNKVPDTDSLVNRN